MINFAPFRKDFGASVIIFLIALPLAIGISIACGLNIYSGIVSGIIGGIVVGALSGNSLQVSGPAAGLILVVVDIIQTQGIEKLFLIIFLAGLVQIVFGLLSLGNWFRAITPAIIQGMLAGIGISIFLSQFHIMLDSSASGTFLANISDLWSIIYNSVLPFDFSKHHLACFIGFLTILIIILWDSFAHKKLKAIPAALVAVIISSLVANLAGLDINYINVGENFWSQFYILDFPSALEGARWANIGVAVLVVTFIASAETLLTSNAIDKMCEYSKTNYNKEIIAQGVGNSLSGLLGALPITGVIVRSAANIDAGARTRLSAILHGVWILLFVSMFPKILNYIPISALAAILVYTGYKLVDIDAAKYLFKLSRGEFAIYLITLFAILFTNLFEGIVLGFLAALVKNVYKVMKVNLKIVEGENLITVMLCGNVTFLQLPSLISVFEKIDERKDVAVCAQGLYFMDHAGIDFLKSWEQKRQKTNAKTQIDWSKIRRSYPNFDWRKFHKDNDGFGH